MHVTRVELENIKSYEHADFRFEPGTTAIVGSNGAGKTTLLESIAWTLFDVLDYSKDDFLRRGAKKGWVRVTFQSDLDERQYTVYRDTGNGYYIVDTALGVRLAERKKDVTDLIHQHLGVEPGTDLKSLFRSAIGVPQGTFTAAFLQQSVQRKAAFDRLLKVEEYREGAEKLLATARLINERITEVRLRIAGAEAQLSRYDELAEEQVHVTEQEQTLDGARGRIEQQVEEGARAITAFDKDEQAAGEARLRLERFAVEHENSVRRLDDARREVAAAQQAVERQAATEDDYARHTAALALSRALEHERSKRDALRTESEAAARRVLAAEMDSRKITDALEGAECARDALVALAPEIERQAELERERERLRDMRARMVAARDAAARLERDLQLLREQHKATSERLKRAERGRGAQDRLEDLEFERMGLENNISAARDAVSKYEHLLAQSRELNAEIARLRQVTSALEAEIEALNASSAAAERLAPLEAEERQTADRVAHLRAEINRDERMRNEVEGGLCPILSQRCLNIGEDETLDGYFSVHLSSNREALGEAETAHAALHLAVRQARDAAASRSQLTRIRQNLQRELELLRTREAAFANVEAELAGMGQPSRAGVQELNNRLGGVNSSIIAARDEALLYAEAEPLRTRLEEIAEEGKARRDEQAELAAAASGVEAIDAEAIETENKILSLNDPRGRAAALHREAGREATLRVEAETARLRLTEMQAEATRITLALGKFIRLDDELRETIAERDRTAEGYRAYLAAAALAATLPARETLVAELNTEVSRLAAEAAQARADFDLLSARYNRNAHTRARLELQSAREQLAATNQHLRHTRERLEQLATDIARLDAIRQEMQDEFREKQRLERLGETTDFVRETLKKAGPLVTESYLYNISIDANQLFREITGDAGRTLRWTRDYEVLLEEAGHERSFANLSGGEQMVAALSIRLSLLKQLSDIRIAIFDEPTTNMDAERRERLAHAIGQVRNFDQLLVISHDDTFEETADHVVAVEARNDESGTTKETHREGVGA